MMIWKMPREQKGQLVEAVQHYFETERGEAIGSIAAEGIVDFMTAALGPYLYNEAMKDARKVVAERFTAVEDELYALEKPLPRLGGR